MTSKIVPDKGWSWIILIAAFFCNVTFDGIIYSFGVFYLDFLDTFGVGRGMTSWIGSVISGVYSVIGPLASILANRFGCRTMTIVGAFISSAGFILSTFSPNIWVMILTYGVMGGIGFGFMYLCAYVMIGHFFEKYRALATGFASCGSGVGTFVFAPMAVYLIEKYTWRGAMWILAGIVLNGVVCGAVFRPIPRERHEDGSKKDRTLIDFGLLRNPAFIILCTSAFLCMLGFFVPFIYLPSYAKDIGINEKQGAFLLSIIGITNMGGRILCGYICDKPWADPLTIYNWALIIGGIATMSTAWLGSFYLLAIYAVIFGICVAAYVSLTAIILVEFLGLDKLSNSFGFLNMFRGFATFFGAPLAGALYDATGTYDLAFYSAGAAIASAGLICLPLRFLSKCKDTQATIEQVEKSLAYRNEHLNIPSTGNSTTNSDLPAAHELLVKTDTNRLYSSAQLLAGSHVSVGLPNPYINYDKVSSSNSQYSSVCDIRYRSALDNSTLTETLGKNLSNSDSVLTAKREPPLLEILLKKKAPS